MKIIILSNSKQPQGGVERFSFYLQDYFEKSGHAVTLLGVEDLNFGMACVMAFAKLIGMQMPVLGYFLGRKALNQGFDVCVTSGLLGWNIKNRKTINVQQGTFAKAAERVDLNRNAMKYLMKRYGWGFFEGLAGRRATRCIAVSEETKKSLEYYYGVKNVQVIVNATDPTFFSPQDKIACRQQWGIAPDQKVAIFVGRFEYAKGKDILEEVKKYLEEKGGELIVAERYSQKELVTLYGASDIFLLPSLHEGCSFALLDAMSVGLPFLASPVGLVADFLQKGLFLSDIIETPSADLYIKKMEGIFSLSEDQRSKLSHELRDYILKSHDISTVGKIYESLAKEVANKNI